MTIGTYYTKKTSRKFISEMKNINSDILILEPYTNAKTKIQVSCKICGNIWTSTPNNLLRKRSCPKCARKLTGRKNSYTHEHFLTLISTTDEIEILGTYKHQKSRIKCVCRLCHYEWLAYPTVLLRNHGCPKCVRQRTTSKGEKEVVAFVREIYDGDVIENDRTILNPKELDIYIPRLNIAIEYNGDYWHSLLPKGYHENKTNGCLKQGIKLLHLWESDWKENKISCKEKIYNLIT